MSTYVTSTKVQNVKQLIKDVEHSGWYIAHIENPPVEVQLAAVKNDYMSIAHIDNPAAATRHAVIRKSKYAITFIDEPSEQDVTLHKFLWEL